MKHYSFLLILFMALCLSLGNGNKAQAGSLQTKGVWVSCFEFEELGLKIKQRRSFVPMPIKYLQQFGRTDAIPFIFM